MKKTLCLILSYNTPDLTTNLYKSLEPYKEDIYDLLILENGSDDFNIELPRIHLSRNVYFGGAMNYAFEYMIDNQDKYDSLLFLNSDLIIHGMNFVKQMRLYLSLYHIISPAIINAEFNQCHWKQMLNWNSYAIRNVKWVDFQAPMFHIDFIKKQIKFPDPLILGWGQDILAGINCEKWNMGVGVVDKCTIVHLNSQTIRRNNNSNDPILKDYCKHAEKNMFLYISNKQEYIDKFYEFRRWGEDYSFSGLVSES